MMKRPGLLPLIFIAIVAGSLIGLIAPVWLSRTMATFNGIFSQFLGFMIPMIIIGFVTPAIGDIGARAGRLLVVTALLAYGATIMAGLFSYVTSSLTFPSLIDGFQSAGISSSHPETETFFTVDIPPFMSVMTALVTSFVLGLGTAFLKGNALRSVFDEFRDIVEMTIRTAIIPLLPIYIFGIFLCMAAQGEVGMIMSCFAKIIGIIFAMHIVLLLVQYSIASVFAGKNPLKMLWTMMPAYFTALGTQSSAATIPVTLRQTIKMGVREDIAGFVVPLCATIHLSGSTLKIVACSLALMVMHGQPHDMGLFIHFITMLGITMIAAPGIPGGAIMASLGLLHSILGFDEQQIALMIALYIAMDSFGTACNVTGDGAIAAIVNRLFPDKKTSVVNEG